MRIMWTVQQLAQANVISTQRILQRNPSTQLVSSLNSLMGQALMVA